MCIADCGIAQMQSDAPLQVGANAYCGVDASSPIVDGTFIAYISESDVQKKILLKKCGNIPRHHVRPKPKLNPR